MLDRRLLLSHGFLAPAVVRATSIMPIRVLASRIITAPVAPAIVSPSSLMPVSPVEQPLRWIARVRYRQGGTTTVIGESSPFTNWHEFPTLVSNIIAGQIPWHNPDSVESSVEIHLLRADDPAPAILQAWNLQGR